MPSQNRRAPGWRATLGAYAIAVLSFVAMDAVWLTFTGDKLYRRMLGQLMRADFALLPAAAFYLLYGLGMTALAILPAANARAALLRGALLGLVCYATYDLSNQATLAGWPWQVTLPDLCWGTLVSAASCAVSRRYMPTQPPISAASLPSKRSGPLT